EITVPIPLPLQPPPPSGPLLTLDPELGIIVSPGRTPDPDGDLPPAPGGRNDGDGEPESAPTNLLPSSWVPIIGALRPRELALHAGHITRGIRELVAAAGMTRLQWLLLLVLAPLATAFLIDVVASM